LRDLAEDVTRSRHGGIQPWNFFKIKDFSWPRRQFLLASAEPNHTKDSYAFANLHNAHFDFFSLRTFSVTELIAVSRKSVKCYA